MFTPAASTPSDLLVLTCSSFILMPYRVSWLVACWHRAPWCVAVCTPNVAGTRKLMEPRPRRFPFFLSFSLSPPETTRHVRCSRPVPVPSGRPLPPIGRSSSQEGHGRGRPPGGFPAAPHGCSPPPLTRRSDSRQILPSVPKADRCRFRALSLSLTVTDSGLLLLLAGLLLRPAD